ncbi:MAG: methylmalonyl Co-A mutase-associated GTPase MeaB [Deltaproteobacteria bacterium]|nr:methylmalonyl Co-A mutase-associated GTPase MeaB [Deltaproteobacteria bacterium]MBW2384056.1 methylmalonyl Co-A mutase-associated GTPase MeaB [Deltaproteobacteria bacterium]
MPPASDTRVSRLLDGLAAGDRSAVSEALNLVDDRRPEERELAFELLDALAQSPSTDSVQRVGMTGAPGAGKSSLLDALVGRLRKDGSGIGVIAVDPSSQRSGGALLGDRMRLGASAREQGVFLRSMAARDRLGGLADATQASATVLSAVYDWVFIETVGVGQSECDVANLVDTLVFVAQPGAGDMLQFMKAGILELPDVFVVNKADIGPVAERTRVELIAGLSLGEPAGSDGWQAPVLLTSARDRVGIDELATALTAHREHMQQTGGWEKRRAQAGTAFVLESLRARHGEYGLDRVGGTAKLRRRIEDAVNRSPFRLVLDLSHEIEDALRKS